MKTGGKLKKNLKKLCWNANFFFWSFFFICFFMCSVIDWMKGWSRRWGEAEDGVMRKQTIPSQDVDKWRYFNACGGVLGGCVCDHMYIYIWYTRVYTIIYIHAHTHTHTHVASMWHILVLPSRIGLEDTEALDRVVPHGGSGLHQGWCFLREQAGPEVFRGPQMGNWGFSSVELFDHAGVLKRSLY